MRRRPLVMAVIVFLVVVAIGTIVITAAGLYPARAVRAFDRGSFVGQTVGVPALLLAVVVYFVARRRMKR